MSLKEIALKLLALYHDAETTVIWEYSWHIEDDIDALADECQKYKEMIEEASK